MLLVGKFAFILGSIVMVFILGITAYERYQEDIKLPSWLTDTEIQLLFISALIVEWFGGLLTCFSS